MKTIVVSGALANKCHNGGEAWVRLSWIRGLQRLGFDVYFIEQIDPAVCTTDDGKPAEISQSANLKYFKETINRFGLVGKTALITADGLQSFGIDIAQLNDVMRNAELLVNISGHLSSEPFFRLVKQKAYIDIDPGFTQFWHADPQMPFQVDHHDFYFTIGRNIGRPECSIPKGGINWRPINQPVVLGDWPIAKSASATHFSTVGSWRGAFGPVSFGGRTYGLKVHEFRKYLTLPQRLNADSTASKASFQIALDIHPADANDLNSLKANDWTITDPRAVAANPDFFRQFVQSSGSEFSVAQGIYVDSNSGWFSDRTIRYLASGKPALVQETGFSRYLQSDVGLVPFSTLEQAIAGAKHVMSNYSEHASAARAIAERYFDSDKVLAQFLDEVGVA